MKVMKKYIVALICAALCMPLVSCDKEEQGQFGDNSTYLPISDMKNVYPLGDVVEVSFTSASTWRVVFNDRDNDATNNWVTVSPSKGNAGTTPLTITIDPYIDKNNLTESSVHTRVGMLEFNAGADTKKFEITQNRAFIKVVEVDDNGNHSSEDMGRDDIAFDWCKDTKRYKVESNVRWMLGVNVDDDVVVDDNHVRVEVNNQEWKSNTLYGQNENESDELSIAVEYNYDGKINANVSFIPCQPKDEVSATDKRFPELERKLKIAQDYLYLKVFETLPYSSNDLKNLQSAEKIEGFSELGDEKVFYVVYQENLEDNYDINMETSLSGVDTSCFECDKDGESAECTEKPDGRTIKWQKYNAKFSKANPDFDNERIITYVIKPTGTNVPDACRRVDFVQDAYLFVIKENGDVVESEKVVANAGGAEYNFTLDTHGEWTVSYPKNVTWASLTFSDKDGELIEGEDNGSDIVVSGSGNATIGVEVADRNLSFDLDNVLNLAFVASNIKEDYPQENAKKSVDFKQPKFEFEISVREPDDTINFSTFNVSSHTTKGYVVRIVSSGSWSVVENSDWVTFDGTSDGWGTTNDAGSLTFSPNENDYSRDFVLKVISKEHKDVEGYEDNYYRELTITQDEIKTNILEYKNGPSLDGNTLSYVAYKKSSDIESSFYMECSAPWTLTQKPSWVTLRKGSEVLYEGSGVDDGEYYTISMVVDNNFGAQSQSGNVSFSVGGKTIGFTVNQDGFVFDVPAFNKTYDPITTDVDELNITLTNEAELNLDDIENWVNLTEKGTVDNGKTTTYKYLVKPGPNVEDLNKDRGRNYTVAVAGIQSLSKNITIKQQKFEWEIDKASLKFGVIRGESSKISISKCTMNGTDRCYDFEFEECDDWLKLSDPSSNGSDELTFETTTTNTSTIGERRGTIRFFVKHPSISSDEYNLGEVDVIQEKYIWSVDYNSETFDPVYSKSSDYESKIAIESSGKWKAEIIEDEDDMIKSLSPKSGNGDDKSVKFTIKPNYTTRERTAVIEIINDDLGASSKKSFTLTQKAYVFKADAESVELEATKGGTASVSFTSSGSKGWTFEVDPVSSDDWLEVKNEDGKLVVTTLKNNDTTSVRSATVTVTDVESKLDVEIEVTQKAKAK